jgi:hypothetical protein
MHAACVKKVNVQRHKKKKVLETKKRGNDETK